MKNNLVHGKIQVEGGEAAIGHNLDGRLEGYFIDPRSGNLQLATEAVGAMKAGELLPAVNADIRGFHRKGTPDLGAWELEKN